MIWTTVLARLPRYRLHRPVHMWCTRMTTARPLVLGYLMPPPGCSPSGANLTSVHWCSCACTSVAATGHGRALTHASRTSIWPVIHLAATPLVFFRCVVSVSFNLRNISSILAENQGRSYPYLASRIAFAGLYHRSSICAPVGAFLLVSKVNLYAQYR